MKQKLKENFGNISIICFVISAILFATNLFVRLDNALLTALGCILCSAGAIFLIYDRDNEPKRGFKVISADMRKSDHVHYPTRSSINSAGYDFYADKDYTVLPNEVIKIWTDIKAYMKSNEVLILNVRSSMGGKFMLANTQGWVDSDYYDNPDNEGNIGIFLKNISNEVQHIKRDDRIAQGMFIEYLTIDNDKTIAERKGGFGSSGK